MLFILPRNAFFSDPSLIILQNAYTKFHPDTLHFRLWTLCGPVRHSSLACDYLSNCTVSPLWAKTVSDSSLGSQHHGHA